MNILDATKTAMDKVSLGERGHEWITLATGPNGHKVAWNPHSRRPALCNAGVAVLTGHSHPVGQCMGWNNVLEGKRVAFGDAPYNHPAIRWAGWNRLGEEALSKLWWVTEDWSSHERPVGTAWVPTPFEGWEPAFHRKATGLYMLNARRHYASPVRRDETGRLVEDRSRRTLVNTGNRGEWIDTWGYTVEYLGEVRSTPEANVFSLEYTDGTAERVSGDPFYPSEYTFLLSVEPA